MTFKEVSDGMAAVVEAVAPGIVRVEGRKRLGATGILWREGVIVTASHVIRQEGGVKVAMADGSTAAVTLVGRDTTTDLAVLRVESGAAPVTLATATPRVGELALALGRPGSSVQATLGVISAIGTGRMQGAIQTDVLMYPGFSGGPLVSSGGEVFGMNTSGFSRGVSIAISAATITTVVDSLLAHGRVRQGFMGVGAQPVRLPEAAASQLDQETGLIIVSLEANGPAASAGVIVGDIVVSLDGEPTPHLDALMMLLSGDRVGREVPLVVLRGGEIRELTLTVGERT